MPAPGEKTEPFGWLCNMTVVRLPKGGCLIYSPILAEGNLMEPVNKALSDYDLLPVRLVIAPTP